MWRGRTVSALLAIAVFASCTARREPGDLTVAQLFEKPLEFDGKRVAVIGYYKIGMEETTLYTSPGGECDHPPPGDIFTCSIWVSPGWRRGSRLTDQYVRIVGTFHYRPQFRREMLKRDDGREFESVTTLGYGHFGLHPAELTHVTSFRPLR